MSDLGRIKFGLCITKYYLCYIKMRMTMTITEIRSKVAEYMRVGFTMEEAFSNIRDAARERSRKTNKVAEARAAASEKNGTTEYGSFGKSWANNKWGKY